MPATVQELVRLGQIIEENALYYGFDRLQLIEAAAAQIAEHINKDFGAGKNITIFCSDGRKGAYGLAIARHLASKHNVEIWLIGQLGLSRNSEFLRNLLILKNSFLNMKFFADSKELPNVINVDIIIECLDSDTKSCSEKLLKTTIELLNKAKAIKVSLDFSCDGFLADKAYSLFVRKSNGAKVIDAGVPKEFFFFTGPAHVKYLRKRNELSHKGENGVALIIAGSKKYHGAAAYAGNSASLFCDLVFLLSHKENITVLKKASSEAIVAELTRKNIRELGKRADAVLIGPGLEPSIKTKKLVKFAIKELSNKKFVIDAGGFKIVNKKMLGSNFLLTPHRVEFKRFFKSVASPLNVLRMANKYNCTIILKGPIDYISDGRAVYCNFTGNALMTAGGTGDVLAGVATAFATKNSIIDSGLASTFLVGFAGDLIAKRCGGLNATKLIEMLPEAKKICENWACT